MRSSLWSSDSGSGGTRRAPASPSRSSWPSYFDRSDCRSTSALLNEPQGACDVDATPAVIRIGPGLAEVVGELKNGRTKLGRSPHRMRGLEQRRESSNVRGTPADAHSLLHAV